MDDAPEPCTRLTYAYDGNGSSGTANPAGDFGVRQVVGTTHTLNPAGANTILDQRTYAWDRMYNKKQRKDIRAGGPMLTHDYTYDRTYRLTRTAVTNGSPPATVRDTDYNLDGVHNRLSTSGTVNGMTDPATGSYTMVIRGTVTHCVWAAAMGRPRKKARGGKKRRGK